MEERGALLPAGWGLGGTLGSQVLLSALVRSRGLSSEPKTGPGTLRAWADCTFKIQYRSVQIGEVTFFFPSFSSHRGNMEVGRRDGVWEKG